MDAPQLIGESLKAYGVDSLFFLLGGPTVDVVRGAQDAGLRCIDVRHEQAAAMMAHGYTRVSRKVCVCAAGSGPDTTNLMTGVAAAFVDAMPMLVLGGSAPISGYEQGSFQEIDQLAMMRPVTKWAVRVHDAHRLPEYIKMGLQRAISGQPGPVYLDLPGDMLYQEIDPARVRSSRSSLTRARVSADPDQVSAAVDQLLAAKRPILVTGSGIFLSRAERALQELAEHLGIPVYPTPQGRGAIPDDHPLCLAGARSQAFRTADTIVVAGTRLNYVIRHAEPPHFDPDAVVIQIEVDPLESAKSARVSLPVTGDAAMVLRQILMEVKSRNQRPNYDQGWLQGLEQRHAAKSAAIEKYGDMNGTPIHPLRLCWEIRQQLSRDAILAVDGHEILNFSRQTIPTFLPGHRLNAGPFGCMGVGIPFAIGAKVAFPDKLVVCITGDGAFGINGFELDTAVRHNIPIVVVISNNGGWTADYPANKPGRQLGFTRYDEMFRPLGCHTEYITDPAQIRPALAAAIESGKVAVLNVITDPAAKAETAPFVPYPSGWSL